EGGGRRVRVGGRGRGQQLLGHALAPRPCALWCALPVMTPPAAETGRSAASQFPRRPGSQTVAHTSGDTTEENMSPRRATAGRPAVTAAQRGVRALASDARV